MALKLETKSILNKEVRTVDGLSHGFVWGQTMTHITVVEGGWKYVIPTSLITGFHGGTVFLSITKMEMIKYRVEFNN
ncbi:MAG: hypothetical protein ACE5J2_07310 [Nitrososphaerales archaeon]